VGSGTSAINHALSATASDIERTAGDVMPFLAGSVGSIGKAISGTVTHAVTGVQSGLADVKSSVTGAILAGVSTVKQGLSNIGTAIVNSTKTDSGKIAATFENGLHYILPPVERVGNAIYTTLGTVGTTVKNVISPIVTTIHNLPTAIVNGTQTLVKGAQSLGQSIASDASNLGIAIKNGTMNALDTIGNTITSAGKEIQNEFGNITAAISGAVKSPFSFFAGLSNNVAHIVEYAAIGIGVVILVVAGIYVFSHNSKRGKGGHHRKK
jgi:phage-related protein